MKFALLVCGDKLLNGSLWRLPRIDVVDGGANGGAAHSQTASDVAIDGDMAMIITRFPDIVKRLSRIYFLLGVVSDLQKGGVG